MRVLHVFGQMNRGGAETLTMNVYRHIDREQVRLDFVVHSDAPGDFDAEIRDLGGRLYPLPAPGKVGLNRYARGLSQILRDGGPFAGIHSHVHLFSGQIVRVADRAGVRLRIAHSHTSQDEKRQSLVRRIYRWYMRRLIHRHATHVFGCSRIACESLLGDNCWQDHRVQVLRNAIDLAAYKVLDDDRLTLRRQLSLPVEGPLIGHVGRFTPYKNQQFLVQAFGALLHDVPTANLVLVGDGPLRVETEELVRSRGISGSVHFMGVRSDVPWIMSALDAFVFPSLYEGLGIVLIEAQAAGLPCVAADTVPTEADLGLGLVQFVSLQAGEDVWANRIRSGLGTPRPTWTRREQALLRTGYDIRSLARFLQEVYTSGA